MGNLLIFPVKDLPTLAKGKGNKMINIPSSKVAAREEFAVDIAILNNLTQLLFHFYSLYGTMTIILKFSLLVFIKLYLNYIKFTHRIK